MDVLCLTNLQSDRSRDPSKEHRFVVPRVCVQLSYQMLQRKPTAKAAVTTNSNKDTSKEPVDDASQPSTKAINVTVRLLSLSPSSETHCSTV